MLGNGVEVDVEVEVVPIVAEVEVDAGAVVADVDGVALFVVELHPARAIPSKAAASISHPRLLTRSSGIVHLRSSDHLTYPSSVPSGNGTRDRRPQALPKVPGGLTGSRRYQQVARHVLRGRI
jgi:hypothetical protein